MIEDLGIAALREGDQEIGTKLLAIALAWKYAPAVSFACDIDESAGMAEVFEMHGHSRKAPCA